MQNTYVSPQLVVAIKQEFINTLIEARLQFSSEAELAESAGVDQSIISRLETGKANPTLDTIIRIIAALGYDLKLAK